MKLYENKQCRVRSIDDGTRIDRVDWSQLRMLMNEYATTPPFASRCSLVFMNTARPVGWGAPTENRHFKQKLREISELHVFIAGAFSGREFGIYLYHRDRNGFFKCLNGMFADDNDAESSTDQANEDHAMMAKPTVLIDPVRLPTYRFTTRIIVKLSHFEKVEAVYLILLTKMVALSELDVETQQSGQLGSTSSGRMYNFASFTQSFTFYMNNCLMQT